MILKMDPEHLYTMFGMFENMCLPSAYRFNK